jgi:hypothetical protein
MGDNLQASKHDGWRWVGATRIAYVRWVTRVHLHLTHWSMTHRVELVHSHPEQS